MKFKKIGLALSIAASMLLSACSSFFEGTNIDPDAAATATPGSLLPTIQTRMAFSLGGDAARYSGIMTQHFEGFDRQFLGYQEYSHNADDFTTLWSNIYAGSLQDIRQLQQVAAKEGSTYYVGIAKVLEVQLVMNTTDLFGDIPYSNALKGTDNLAPQYDTQQAIYTALEALLTEARTSLNTTPKKNGPFSDDLMYGGDMTSWRKYANLLAARLALHKSNKDNAAATKALAALSGNGGAFTSNADNAVLTWGAASGIEAGPMNQYLESRQGDADINNKFLALLKSFNDPRNPAGGSRDSILLEGDLFGDGEQTFFGTFAEQKFIEAEAQLRNTNPVAARAAYLAGIQASFAQRGYTTAQYNAYIAQTKVNPVTLTLNDIMTQKYLALYMQLEVFVDTRRTGFPALTPNVGSKLPYRFLYPQTERDLNTNSPKNLTIFDKVWWMN